MSDPPYYILVSHSPSSLPLSTSLSHPIIHYHYRDDSPLPILPKSPNDQVLILDYDPSTSRLNPAARSLSHNVAVTGVKVADAPGAGASAEGGEQAVNDKMYIIETTLAADEKTSIEVSQGDLHSPYAILARFKQRNTILRRALEYPGLPLLTNSSSAQSPTNLQGPDTSL